MRVFSLAVALLCCLSATGQSQEFRVFTTVSDVSGERPIPLSRSLTLFHAGQAWDHAVESGQVVRFDPADEEFVILDTRRDLACTVKLEELKRVVQVGRKATEDGIASLKQQPTPASRALADSLAFQLTPRYETTDEADANRLQFVGGPLTYQYEYATPGRPSVAASYWDFRDWTAQLNFAMAPPTPVQTTLFPDVYRPMHEELRERGVVPQRIDRTLADDPMRPPRKHASEHAFQEKLDPRDRELISEWRARLASPKTRVVPFAKYVQLTLGAKTQAAR
ncbi:MAG: hypothetical protein AAF907_00190 [Planctomycetota bacterium]